MKLHIGCGKRYFKGWTNLDIVEGIADVVDDARILTKIPDNSCEIIYAAHVIEHFDRNEVKPLITTWFEKLAKDGILRLSTPDFAKIVYMYKKSGNIDPLISYLLGGQKDDIDFHKMLFDKNSLTKLLKEIGFKTVRLWNWRKVDHGEHDDYSQAYLPHMDKEHGTMMSLNIEAVK